MTLSVITRLGRLLDEHRPHYDRLDTYYRGKQSAHHFMAPEVRASLGNRLPPLVLNWPRLVISALEERLDVDGFRLGRDEPADTELCAERFAGIWSESMPGLHASVTGL